MVIFESNELIYFFVRVESSMFHVKLMKQDFFFFSYFIIIVNLFSWKW